MPRPDYGSGLAFPRDGIGMTERSSKSERDGGRMSRAMGLDVGSKTIGVALSDPSYLIAQAHGTIQRTSQREDIQKILDIIQKEEVREVVLGLPKHMNGDQGRSVDRAKSLGRALEEEIGRPVVYQDERMTTLSADRVLQKTGVRREHRKKYVDSIAATFILQTWLDKEKRSFSS